jgi:hypothetical protein
MYLVTTKEDARHLVLYCLFDYIISNGLESPESYSYNTVILEISLLNMQVI